MSLRKPRKPPTKRAAAAVTETPGQSVVAVPPTDTGESAAPDAAEGGRPGGSMPPTDLDVVDMVVDLRALEDARQPAPIGTPPAPQGGPPAA
ncbi:MAG TPA: hypothetical protein VEG38_09340 [Acidimicrobiia bacterium]|nr:hypothetical protein [Acidimicrobiia bacterium]